ncbi:STAS domain-containing protein [candidate division KSB1 bacterium]|nr:STAS domain-containing protein [candidate division KSB1 bacterium]
MAIKADMQGDVAVINLKGKLMGGPDTKALHDKVRELADSGSKKLVIDLGQVKWMNSTGLGALMGALTTAKNHNAELKLARVTDKVQSLFMMTKLITVFETHDTLEEAVSSFS